MAVSEAKLAANRRNAMLSSGPRSVEGKRRSSQNAVTHGLRAETLILLDEDPQALDDRREAWRACLLPGDDVEERLVDSAVVHTWLQDRARRAQAARLNVNILDYGVDEAQTDAQAVDDLGRRLFKDRLGPLVFYPSSQRTERRDYSRTASTSAAEGGQDDPDRPAALILSLQSTLLGCEWLLREWAGLKAILDRGQAWLSADKLKAVRLLGKQPFDAIDDRDVAMVFLASFELRKDKGAWYWEIAMEMAEIDIKRFRNSGAVRELDSLKPEDAAKARKALLDIIERATERLKPKANALRERARMKAALAADCLAFDDSREGEYLRRSELASGRIVSRSLDDLRKHRRSNVSSPLSVVSGPLSVVSSPLSVVSGPLSVASYEAEAITEAIATNEPTVALENATNEPTDACENSTNEPTAVQEIATNEPTAVQEIATNEPTVALENVTNEPTVALENVTNEPTADQENATNEPLGGPLSVVRCLLPVDSCTVESIDERGATNEPTEVQENASSEPTLATDGDGAQSVELGDSTDDRNEKRRDGRSDREKMSDWIQDGLEMRKLARDESLRKLNEQARKQVERAMAARRLRDGESKNANPREQPEDREARARQSTKQEITARTETELERALEIQTPFRANTPGKPSERDLRQMEEAVAAYHFAVRQAAERGRRTSDAEVKENGARESTDLDTS